LINTGAGAVSVGVIVKGVWKGTRNTRGWVTDNRNDMTEVAVVVNDAGVASMSVSGRGMASLFVNE
jgi:hypothetical protein